MVKAASLAAAAAAVALAAATPAFAAEYDETLCPKLTSADFALISPMATCGAAGGNPMPCFHDKGICDAGGAQEKWTKCKSTMREVFEHLNMDCDSLLGAGSEEGATFDPTMLCGVEFGWLLDGVCIVPGFAINLMRSDGGIEAQTVEAWEAYLSDTSNCPGTSRSDCCPREPGRGEETLNDFFIDGSCIYQNDGTVGAECPSGYFEIPMCTDDAVVGRDWEFCCRSRTTKPPTPPPTDAPECKSEFEVKQQLSGCGIYPITTAPPTPAAGGGGGGGGLNGPCPTFAELGVLTKVFPQCGPLGPAEQKTCMENLGACPGTTGEGQAVQQFAQCGQTLDVVMTSMNIGLECHSLLGAQAAMCDQNVGPLLLAMCSGSGTGRVLSEVRVKSTPTLRRATLDCNTATVGQLVSACVDSYGSTVCGKTPAAACAASGAGGSPTTSGGGGGSPVASPVASPAAAPSVGSPAAAPSAGGDDGQSTDSTPQVVGAVAGVAVVACALGAVVFMRRNNARREELMGSLEPYNNNSMKGAAPPGVTGYVPGQSHHAGAPHI